MGRVSLRVYMANASRPSSHDLHPRSGGRFVLERIVDPPGAEYEVQVYLPDGVMLRTRLRWTGDQAVLEPPLEHDWAQQQTFKLARVLRRDPKPRLNRWRG